MRAAQGRKDSGPPRTKGDAPILSSQGACTQDAEQITGLGMPTECWERFSTHIKEIATLCGLSVKVDKRYIDPIGVVYIKFNRKEKDV